MLATCAALACHASPYHAGWAGTIDTTTSGTIVVHNPKSGLWDSASAWRVTRTLRLGTVEGVGPAAFGRIESVAVGEDGAIYILDGQANEIREFDSTGRWVRTFGRSGHGPGEFANPNGMAWGPHGNLWVMDPAAKRLTVFDTSGAFAASYLVASGGYVAYPWRGTIEAGGQLVDVGMRFGPTSGTPVLVAFDSSYAASDTFPLPAFATPRFTVRRQVAGGTSVMASEVPFAPALEWRLDRHEHLWFTITGSYRLFERTLPGDTLLVFDKPFDAPSVSREERAQNVATVRKWAGAGARHLDFSRIPAIKPAIRTFVIDADGDAWIVPSEAAGTTAYRADVFDSSGRYLGPVALPGVLPQYPRPVITHAAVYAVQTDSLGVNYVERWTIERP